MKKIIAMIIFMVCAFCVSYGQNILPSATGKKFTYFQIKGVYDKPTVSNKVMSVDPNPKRDVLLISFFGKNMEFMKYQPRVATLSNALAEFAMSVSVLDDSTLSIWLIKDHPANRCVAVMPNCDGFPINKFKEQFFKIFGIIPRFSMHGENSQYKGIWEAQSLALSLVNRNNEGQITFKPGKAAAIVNSEDGIYPLFTFETIADSKQSIIAITIMFRNYGKTIIANKDLSYKSCHFFDNDFKIIEGQQNYNSVTESYINDYTKDFVDLPDNIKPFLTPQVIQYWKNCK